MDERGWGWTASESWKLRLVEWLVLQSGAEWVPVKPFYDQNADPVLTLAVADDEPRGTERDPRALTSLIIKLSGLADRLS